MTVKTFVLFDMLRYISGHYIVVSKYITEERRKFVAMLGSGFFHKSDFGGASFRDLGPEKMPIVD